MKQGKPGPCRSKSQGSLQTINRIGTLNGTTKNHVAFSNSDTDLSKLKYHCRRPRMTPSSEQWMTKLSHCRIKKFDIFLNQIVPKKKGLRDLTYSKCHGKGKKMECLAFGSWPSRSATLKDSITCKSEGVSGTCRG